MKPTRIATPQLNPEPLVNLSEEFLAVVDRIQDRLSDRLTEVLQSHRANPETSLGAAQLDRITAAEQKVDSCAANARSGQIEPGDWQAALTDYESAWLQVVERLGDRQN